MAAPSLRTGSGEEKLMRPVLLCVDVDGVTDTGDEIPGEVLWLAQRSSEPDLLVKVYGRDAWDTQAIGSLWAALTRRGEMPHLGRSRQSRVEHEALAAQRCAMDPPDVLIVDERFNDERFQQLREQMSKGR